MPPAVNRWMLRTLLVVGVLSLGAASAHADARSDARDAVVGCWNVGSGVTLVRRRSGPRGLEATARFTERPHGGPARQRSRARWIAGVEAFEVQCRPRSQHGSFCHVRPRPDGLGVTVHARGRGGTYLSPPSETLVATRCATTAREAPMQTTASEATPAPAPTQDGGFAWTPLTGTTLRADIASRWGVVVNVPEATRARFESPYDRYALTTAHCTDYCVTIARVRAPMPAEEVAVAAFLRESMGQQPEDAVTLARGTTPAGTLFVARRFTVRVGVPGVAGQSIHYVTEVSRFFAAVPLDATSHLVCTGYVEHPVTSMDDPAMRAARDVCLSLARVR